jgi:hypothetical protein
MFPVYHLRMLSSTHPGQLLRQFILRQVGVLLVAGTASGEGWL